MSEASVNDLFVGLLMHLQYTAWIQLGKVAHPGTGKVARDLEAAKETIDLLGALQEKTHGNLHADEEKLLSHFLLELRMNYVEEREHGTPPAATPEGPAAEPAAGT